MEPSVVAPVVAKILAAAGLAGGNPAALAAAAGIAPEVLADREGRVPLASVQVLLAALERQLGDAAFGLHLAEMARAGGANNVLSYAVQSSRTYGEALQRSVRYTRFLHDAAELQVIHDGDRVRARYLVHHGDGAHPYGAQFSLAQLVLSGYGSLAGRYRVLAVSFRHPEPADAAARETFLRVFRVQPAFGEPHDEVVLPRALLDEEQPGGDAALSAHLDRHIAPALERAGGDAFLVRVRRAVGEDLSGGLPDIDGVAARLRMSSRSLQRRLRDAGTSFQKELDLVRRDLALRYLDEPMSLAEVAFLTGFSEPSNFHRAFKRWTGRTPAEARRQRVT